MSERRLDVAESRRAFGSGAMKAPTPYVSPFAGLCERLPVFTTWTTVCTNETIRRARLARWQVPRV